MPLGLLREKHRRFPWGRTQDPGARFQTPLGQSEVWK